MTERRFVKLNDGWNAEPNVPEPRVQVAGNDVLLSFAVNSTQYQHFNADEVGILWFRNCLRYRLGSTNDEGWYLGQCRYSRVAPAWGEFYEITGDDPLRDDPNDWVFVSPGSGDNRHFLFYLRDNTFEAIAGDWSFADVPDNALLRIVGAH